MIKFDDCSLCLPAAPERVYSSRTRYFLFKKCPQHIYIIGASVARPPLGVGRQLFYIFIYIFIYLFIYLYIWCRGHPGYQDPSRRRGCSAAMKRAWLSAAYACVVDHYRIHLLRTVARYAEVHSALQPAGEAARL